MAIQFDRTVLFRKFVDRLAALVVVFAAAGAIGDHENADPGEAARFFRNASWLAHAHEQPPFPPQVQPACAGVRGRLVLLQRPVDHVGQAIDPGIVRPLDDIHQSEPVLADRQIGKTPHRAGGVFADRLLITSRGFADSREQHDVVAGEQRLVGGSFLAEAADDLAKLHDRFSYCTSGDPTPPRA